MAKQTTPTQKLTLNHSQLESLSVYYGVIKKHAPNEWTWEIMGAPVPPPEINTVPDKQSAVTNCQFYCGGCYLIVEACGEDKYRVVKNSLAQEYLNGVTAAAHNLTAALEETAFYGAPTPAQKIKILEEKIFAAAAAAGYPEPLAGQGLQTYHKKFGTPVTNLKAPVVFTRKELAQLKLKFGIIEKKDGHWLSHIPSASHVKRYWHYANEHSVITGGSSRAMAIKRCHSYGLPLIVEKAAPAQYTVVYNNQRNEYLSGLMRGFAVTEAFFKSLRHNENYHEAVKFSLSALKEIVNGERRALGFKALKNQPHYYGFEVLKWRKADARVGLQNSC